MITYEVHVFDRDCGVSVFPVHFFLMACRLFDSISLDDSMIYSKALWSHDWNMKKRYLIRSESV